MRVAHAHLHVRVTLMFLGAVPPLAIGDVIAERLAVLPLEIIVHVRKVGLLRVQVLDVFA